MLKHVTMKLNNKTVILYDNDTYPVSGLSKVQANGRDVYVLFSGDTAKKIIGEHYQNGDVIALLEDTQLVKEGHDHWRSLAKGIILHSDYTVNREAMTRCNNLVFRCWED